MACLALDVREQSWRAHRDDRQLPPLHPPTATAGGPAAPCRCSRLAWACAAALLALVASSAAAQEALEAHHRLKRVSIVFSCHLDVVRAPRLRAVFCAG